MTGETSVATPEVLTLEEAAPKAAWQTYREAGVPELLGSLQLSYVLQACAEVGLAERLRDGVSTEAELAEGLDEHLTRHTLRYLAIKRVVDRDGDAYRLTEQGRKLLSEVSLAQIGFYVEAYGPVMERIPERLTGEQRYGRDVVRDGAALGRHSAAMFHTFHAPTVQRMLEHVDATCVLDVGCGAGPLLVAACRSNPDLKGVGLDIDPE